MAALLKKLVGKGKMIRSVGFAKDGKSIALGKEPGSSWTVNNYGPLQQIIQLGQQATPVALGGKVKESTQYFSAIDRFGRLSASNQAGLGLMDIMPFSRL